MSERVMIEFEGRDAEIAAEAFRRSVDDRPNVQVVMSLEFSTNELLLLKKALGKLLWSQEHLGAGEATRAPTAALIGRVTRAERKARGTK